VAEREGLDVPALLFDDQLFPMGEDGSHNILVCQLPADEIGNPMDIDVTVGVHLSDKRDLPLGQRETKVSFGVPVGLQSKPPREMSHTSPLTVSHDSRKPGPLLLLRKSPMGFVVVIIAQESLVHPFESRQGGTAMAAQHPLLPELIKTLHRGVSARLPGRNKDQMNSQQQVQANDLREAVGVATSSCGRHLVIDLRGGGDSQLSPSRHQMPTERRGLLIPELTARHRMADHVHGVEGVESGNPLGSSQVSGTHQIGLMQISHLDGFDSGIGLSMPRTTLPLRSLGAAVTEQDSGNRGQGRDCLNATTLQLPGDGLWPNATKS